MNIPKTIEEVKYNSKYWWDLSFNSEANVQNGLPNCTAFVVGAISFANMPRCVSVITDARNWHKHLTNGWVCVPYSEYRNNIKVGDVIEWEQGNHVAIVSNIEDGDVWISGSFYTGIHGTAYYDGAYDTRDGITSLKQLSDFFIDRYQYRYFHHVPLEEEKKWCGGEPEYVLVSPLSVTPTDKNIEVDQIYVGVTGLRVRTEANTEAAIRGVANVGYYNVSEVIEGGSHNDGNIWYKLGDLYVAGVNGVAYYPKQEIVPLEEMMRLMEQMKVAYLKVIAERDELQKEVDDIERIIKKK